jgi:hypothetical protein
LLPITQFGKKILVGPSGKVSYILTSFFSFLFSIMKEKKKKRSLKFSFFSFINGAPKMVEEERIEIQT